MSDEKPRSSEKRPRRVGVAVAKWIGIGIAAVLVLVVGAVGLLQTDYAKERLARFIETEGRGADGSGVKIGAVEGFLPFDVVLHDVAVTDRDGAWLTVEEARVVLSVSNAVRGAIVAERVALTGVAMTREPATDPAAPKTPLIPETLPAMPVAAIVKNLTAERIDIAAPVLGTALQLDLTGRAALAPAGESTAALTITRRAPTPATTELAARYTGGGRHARLALTARETGPGVLAALAEMDAVPGLSATLDVTNDKRLTADIAADIDGRPLGDTPLGRALGAETKLKTTLVVAPTGDITARNLDLKAAQLSVAGSARLTDGFNRIDAKLEYDVPNLAPASALAGAPLGGAISGQVAATGTLDRPAVDLTYAARDLAYDTTAVATLDGSATLRGPLDAPQVTLDFDASGVRHDTASIASLKGKGTIEGSIDDPTVTLSFDAGDLKYDTATVAKIEGNGTVRRALTDPAVELRFDARDLRRGEAAAAKVAGTASAAKIETTPEGRIDVNIIAANLEAQVATAYALDGNQLRLRDLSVRERGATSITGTLDIALDTTLASGRVAGKVADLAPWSSLAGMKLAGALDFDARLSTAQGQQNAKVEANGQKLSVRPPGGDRITAAKLALDADLRDVLGQPKGRAKLTMSGGGTGDLDVKSLAVTAEGDDTALKFDADAALKLDREVTLSTAGRIARGQNGEHLILSSLKGKYDTQAFALARPLDVTRQGTAITVAPTSLVAGDGRINLGAKLNAETVDATVDIVRLPLKLVRLFVPSMSVDGTLAGRVRVTGPAAAPEAQISMTADRLSLQDTTAANLPKLAVHADGQAKGGRLTMKANITGLPGQPFVLDATMPVTFSAAPFAFDLPDNKPVKASLNGATDLALLSSIVPIGEARLAGRADIAISVEGTLAAPRASGTVTLADGRYENLLTGTLVDKIALKLAADGSTVRIQDLSATDGGSGKLSGSGRVALSPEGAGQADARLRLDSFTTLRLDEAQATVSGDLTLDGTPAAWNLGGKLEVDRAELKIPDKLPGRVVDLKVTFVNGGGPTSDTIAPGGKTPEEKPVEINLDIGVEAPARVFVRGRGLDSEWRGNLKITGTATAPQVNGTLSVVRGTFDQLGKSFKLTRGTLSFYGTNVDNPDIDFQAETSAPEITAQINVTGTVQQPDITLTSTPPYPQDEILSRVLFGKGSGQLTAFEAVQLAQAAAALAGNSTGPDITDFLRSATGLDVLRLEQGNGSDSSTGTTLKVGKYVADNVFVSVDQGVTGEDSSVGVEIELTPNISVETSVGNVTGPKAGVNYKIDY